MLNNGRPLPARKKIQFMVALTILAWATQTLMAQWSQGAEVDTPRDVTEVESAAAHEDAGRSAFVPQDVQSGATLELRGEAKIYGADVKLKQVCRWSSADAAMFAPLANLVIAKIDGRRPFRVIEIDELRKTLGDAGVNVALVRFSGPIECTVSRRDVKLGEGEALDQWIQAHGGAAAAEPSTPAEKPAAQPQPQPRRTSQPAAMLEATPAVHREPATAAGREPPPTGDEEPSARTLRAILAADLSVRLGVPAADLQVTFDPQDEHALNLGEPHFKFNVEPRRARDLGEVSWDVTLVGNNGSRKAQIRATARAWQDQVIVTRPLSRGQVIRRGDVAARRTLADRLPAAPLLAGEQAVGQIAARELKPGTLLTAPLVEAVPLAKVGQFITITLNRGNIRIKSVGKALEGGSYGETIRVKNEATRDVYQVVLTGPQQASMTPPAAAEAPEGVASLGSD